jgi:lipopolysaccharide transport system ATP-binding protein
LATFLRDGNQPVHRTKPYHNPNERRLGNREAEIVDFLVLVDGKPQFGPLTGQEALNIYIKVRFRRDVELPRVGWALATTEGIIIGGSNTVMQGNHLPSVCGGQTSIYRLELRPALCGGQYFITVGVGECPNQDWTYFDVRRSVIHIEVADSGHAAGFFHIPSSCENVDDLRG